MFGRRFVFGRILGFEIRADPTWAILFLLILWSLASGFFPAMYPGVAAGTAWGLALVGTLGLFASLLFHELAHSVVARSYGVKVGGITLFLFGGAAEMESEPASPRAELLIAGAGPLASLFLAVAFYGVTGVVATAGAPDPIVGLPYYLAVVNLALAVFNLLPAFPMDGGRLLRAALWGMGRNLRRATKVASRMGQGFGLLLIAGGAFQAIAVQNFVGGMWWVLIGVFIHGNAGMTYKRLLDRLSLKGLTVGDVMTRRPVTVDPDSTIQQIVDEVIYRYHHHRYPVASGRRLLGWIGARQVQGIERARWPELRVGEVMAPADTSATIPASADAETALDRLQARRDGWLMVTDRGALVGVVALRDLQAYLRLRAELGGRAGPPQASA